MFCLLWSVATVLGTPIAMAMGMLRITTQHQNGTVVLRLEGRLYGPWVDELRDCWRRARLANGDETIRVELADVHFVDRAGKALLTQMHRAGADILARGVLTTAIRDEIVAGRAATKRRGAR